jgi:hypothetical protein
VTVHVIAVGLALLAAAPAKEGSLPTEPSILDLVAKEIVPLAPIHPQLAAFRKTAMVTERELSYVYHAAPDPSIRAGWRRGYPLPGPDGVVISIQLISDEEKAGLQQALPEIGRLGDAWALVRVFDGKKTRPLHAAILEILRRHGYVAERY